VEKRKRGKMGKNKQKLLLSRFSLSPSSYTHFYFTFMPVDFGNEF
jgi:hypothetical protein